MRRSTVTIMLLLLLTSMPVAAAITHRYDFAVDANDVVGTLQTTLENGAVVQDGALVLTGGSPGARAMLDATGIAINSYANGASIEAWFTDNSVSGQTRIFDLGDTSGNSGGYYWFYTPSGPGNSRLVISTNGFPGYSAGEQFVNGPVLTPAQKYHLVCVYDVGGGTGGASAMRIYQDGVLVGENNSVTLPLSGVHNAFAYLGSAVYPSDPELNGSIYEFRIYDKALNAGEVRFTNHFGPDDARPIVIRSSTPVNGQTLVSTTPTLSWTLEPGITADSYNLYYGTDPNIADPNKSDISGISTPVIGLTSTTYAITSSLPNGTDYYWRVDTVAGSMTYQGVGSMFTTLPPYPILTTQPVNAYVWEGQTAVMTVTCESNSPWNGNVQWFKVGNPDIELTSGGDVTIFTEDVDPFTKTSTLTIANADLSDAGAYYAKAANVGGPTESTRANLVIKRLLAYYQFEGDPNDSSGNGLDGTILTPSGAAATAAYVSSMTPEMGQAISFTGTGISDPSNATDPYVDLPEGFSDFSQGLTISVWVNPASTAAWQRILQFGNGNNGANNSFYFTRNASTTQIRFENDNTNPTSATRVTAGNDTFVNNTWQMLTVTLSTAATNNAVIYRNGVAVATGTVTLPNVVTRMNCYLGRSEWNGDFLFQGLMDDVRIYNYPLSAEDIAQQYLDATPEEDYVCLPGSNPLTYDVNKDCRVNLADIAELAQNWLGCERIPTSACGW